MLTGSSRRLLTCALTAGSALAAARAPTRAAAQPRAAAPPPDTAADARRGGVCFRNLRPAPDCGVLVVYEVGIYEPFAGSRAAVAPEAQEKRQPFAIGAHIGFEAGVLRNRGVHAAVGATLGAGVGDVDRASLKARYRRWGVAPSGSRFAVDVAAGPVVTSVAAPPRTGPARTLGDLEHPTAGGVTSDVSLELIGQFGAAARGDVVWVRGRPVYGATGGIHTASGTAVGVTLFALAALGAVLGTIF